MKIVFEFRIASRDLKNLIASDQLDWVYIDKWIKQLNLRTFDLLDK